MEEYIEQSINEIPCKTPINLEENIPNEILNLRNHKNYNNLLMNGEIMVVQIDVLAI